MSGPVFTTGPWYRACALHQGPLARMPFERALAIAQGCEDCQTGMGAP